VQQETGPLVKVKNPGPIPYSFDTPEAYHRYHIQLLEHEKYLKENSTNQVYGCKRTLVTHDSLDAGTGKRWLKEDIET